MKLETFVWILKHISRFIAWSLFILKASYKWPVSTLSFMWWCQFIDLLKFETRSSFLLNFGTANVKHSEREILRDLSSTYLPKRGLGLGFSVAKMSQMSGVSRRTIYHRMQSYCLLNTFSLWSDAQLDEIFLEYKGRHGCTTGRTYLAGSP